MMALNWPAKPAPPRCGHSDAQGCCGEHAPWFVVYLRRDGGEHFACETHAIEALRETYCEVSDEDGELYGVGDDGELVPR